MKMCKKLDKGAIPRAARGADHLLTIVVYRKGEEESLDAPEPDDVLVHPKVMENRQITITNTQSGGASKPTDVRIEGGLIKVELSGELTNKLGKGIYRLDLTYDEPNSHYADGKRHIALSKEVCNVVDPKDATEPMAAEIRLEVQAMLKGDKGDSAYEWAVKEGLCSTPEQFVEVFRGATGLSAYELYLATTTDSPKMTLPEWLASFKGETGDSAYQSYVKTHTGGEVLSERDWSNMHNYSLGVLHRLLRGKNVPMEEKKLTGEELIELHTTIQKLATALQTQGIQANEEEGLESFIPKVEAYEPMHIVLFRVQQLYAWRQRTVGRFVEISQEWASPDLSHMFSENALLERLPEIRGINRVVSANNMARRCGLQGVVSIPNLPSVTSSAQAFSSCESIERLIIGDMPVNKSILQIAYDCGNLRYVEIGAIPAVEDVSHALASCRLLERAVFTGGVAPSRSATSLFQSDESLRSVEGVVDLSAVDSYQNIVYGCAKLESIKIKGLGDSINLSLCIALNAESLRYLIDNAKEVTGKTIYLPRKFFAERKEEMEAIGRGATAKGFTINYQ